MKRQLSAEEQQLAEMESVQAKQAELAARRAKLERARYEAEAALTEARMQNEVAQIALLEQETEALTRKRLELQAGGSRRGSHGGGVPLMGVDEGVAMPSMIEQPPAVAPALMSKRSLYDMMGAEAASNAAEQAGVTKGIYPLSEAEQEATDVEDEHDPTTGRGAASSRRGGADSALHAAAGAGRIADVRSIISADPAIAHSVDNVNRNALFYASINGHAEVVQLLMSQAAESCLVHDVNGDTALHAAMSVGARECGLALLQSAPSNITEIENVLGMRPAHLAKDRACIELLASAGAILNAEDKQLRVPLFIACAMNRLDVAQYLCEVLQASPDELTHVDHRGDTPTHAAACNGSLHCLQMFLDLGGLSLQTRNKKGYRPVDLAARRGHADCERILANFASQAQSGGKASNSNDYFDNILFQATVRGRQMCEEAIEADGEYEIIRHSNPSASDDEVRRMHSLWSSRREKSMRLQQFGNWIAYEDKVLKTVFWYNSATQESQWDKPDEVTAIQNAKLAEAKGQWEALRKTSMRLKRIGEWVEYHGNGKTFYYKESTGEFMYERPIDMVRGNRTYRVDFALIYNRFPLFYLFAFGTAC
jgi:ankyrin repeat protein